MLRFNQQRQTHGLCRNAMRQPLRRTQALSGIAHGNLGSDVRTYAGPLCGHVKARRAVESVAVEQCHGGHVEFERRAPSATRAAMRLRES